MAVARVPGRKGRKKRTAKPRQIHLVVEREEVLAMLQDSMTDLATEVLLRHGLPTVPPDGPKVSCCRVLVANLSVRYHGTGPLVTLKGSHGETFGPRRGTVARPCHNASGAGRRSAARR